MSPAKAELIMCIPYFLDFFFCFRAAVVCACMCVYSEISLIEVEVGKRNCKEKKGFRFVFFCVSHHHHLFTLTALKSIL